MIKRLKACEKKYINISQSAPIASYLLDLHGGLQGNLSRYYPAMFLNGGMALVAAILAGGIRLYINNNLRRRL